MNGWDLVTWLSAVVLATSAVVIFGFFTRDARSILNREMHPDDEEEPSDSGSSGSSSERAQADLPEDQPR